MDDFNIDLLKYNDDKTSWMDIMENYHFTQLIKEPTRITDNTSTLNDHIFASQPDKVQALKFLKLILVITSLPL